MEKISLGSHFTYKTILRHSLAPILMMLFTSLYSIIDGLFVSNFDGGDAFAGLNLIYPIIMLVGGTGFMFASGGGALTSKLLGEKKNDEANKTFSMIVIVGVIAGIILSICVFPFIDEISYGLANLSADSTQEMINKAILYGRILILGQPLFILQDVFHHFFVVDEKPKLGFLYTLYAGLTNIVLDALFVGAFKWGIVGAAVATIIGYAVGGVGPVIYFIRAKNNDLIKLVKTKINLKVVFKCCFNGLSDFIFNVSTSIVGIIYNIQLLKYIGQDGVSAYGVIMYVSFIAIAIFIGFDIAMQPIIGYNFGAQNHKELKNVIKRLLTIFTILSIGMVGASIGLARPLAIIFSSGNDNLVELTTRGLMIYSINYLFAGFCILITGMFTALNNGLVSGIISLFRSLVFQIVFVFVLPLIFGEFGIWFAIVAGELFSLVMAFIFFFGNKKKYHY